MEIDQKELLNAGYGAKIIDKILDFLKTLRDELLNYDLFRHSYKVYLGFDREDLVVEATIVKWNSMKVPIYLYIMKPPENEADEFIVYASPKLTDSIQEQADPNHWASLILNHLRIPINK